VFHRVMDLDVGPRQVVAEARVYREARRDGLVVLEVAVEVLRPLVRLAARAGRDRVGQSEQEVGNRGAGAGPALRVLAVRPVESEAPPAVERSRCADAKRLVIE